MPPTDLPSISVVVLNSFCHAQGGASRVAIDEAIDLANMGIDVTFFGAVGPICEELSAAPLKVVCLEQREIADSGGRPDVMLLGLWNFAAHKAMTRVLRTLDRARTIVHVHGFTQALSTSPIHSALDNGFKVLYTMHDFFLACPTGAFFDFQSSTPCNRQALSYDCITTNCDKRLYAHKLYRVARSAIQLHFGGLPRRVKNYISLSKRSEAVLRTYLPTDAHVYSLSNPIGTCKSPPVDAARNTNIVVVGRLDPEKGTKILIEAARLSGTRLTLIGDGPLRGLAESSGLCRVTGWMPRDQVLAELESARCLVFPSLWYETYGLAVAEAASRGIPAIVSDISAAAERVVDGVTGWHMRSGDAQDLVRCFDIAKDDSAIRSAGRDAYDRWWSDPPTRQRHSTELTNIYKKILNSSDENPVKAANM